MVARQDIALAVRDHRTFYEALVSNGFILPTRSSNIVTLEFMFDLLHDCMWCPKRGDVIDATIVSRPPPRRLLVKNIKDGIEDLCTNHFAESDPKIDKLMSLLNKLEKRDADHKWLVQVLYCVNKDDPIFFKSYAYRKPKKSTDINTIPIISNHMGFFDNLP